MKRELVLVALVAAAVGGCTGKQKPASGSPEVQLSVTERGFEPARVEVPRGQAVTLVVTRKTDHTCANEILIPALNENRELPLDQAVRIEVPAGVADSLTYSCAMHMFGGTIVAR